MAEAVKNQVVVAPTPTKAQEDTGELERLKKENEDLKKQIEEMKKGMESKDQEAKAQMDKEKECAAKTERNRIKALEDIAPLNCQAILSQAKSEGWAVERAAVEFLKVSKNSVNLLRAESVVVPSFVQSKSADDEQIALSKRMAESINRNRVRS